MYLTTELEVEDYSIADKVVSILEKFKAMKIETSDDSAGGESAEETAPNQE